MGDFDAQPVGLKDIQLFATLRTLPAICIGTDFGDKRGVRSEPSMSACDAVNGSSTGIAMCQLRLLFRYRECPLLAHSGSATGIATSAFGTKRK